MSVLLMLISVSQANAKVWIIVEDATDEIYSLSPEDDAVMPDTGYTKHIVDLNFKDIELMDHPTNYKYKNDKFIMNIQKISDKENKKEENKKGADDLKLIRNKAYKIACDALVADGVTLEKIKCKDFE